MDSRTVISQWLTDHGLVLVLYWNAVHPHCFYHRTSESVEAEARKETNFCYKTQMSCGRETLFNSSNIRQIYQYPMSDIKRESDGLFYKLSSEQTIAALKICNAVKFLHPDLHNQTLCHFIWQYDLAGSLNFLTTYVKEIYYGEFCEPTRDMSKIYTLQANCCENLEAKVHDLNLVLDISRKTNALVEMGTNLGQRLSSSGKTKCFTR